MTDEAHSEDPNRKADGTFAEGNKYGGNTQRGLTTRAKRIEQLDQKYPTFEALEALFIKTTYGYEPGAELKKLHPRDVALLSQSFYAIMGGDRRGERESFWDREEGKPLQRNEFTGKDGGAIEYADATAARQALLGRTVPGSAAGDTPAEANPTDEPASPGAPA